MLFGGRLNARKDCKILLAEDCPDSQLLLSHILRDAGARVTCASNGVEALEKALAALNEEKPFDLVLLDVQMPQLDGHSTARELRQKGYKLPILTMTAKCSPTDEEDSLEAGCNSHVSKLSGPKKLVEAVGKLLPKNKPATTQLPALPLVPELLKQNTDYAAFALEFINKLPQIMSDLKRAIDESDYDKVAHITQRLGALSLYGYTIFAACVRKVQIAAESSDRNELVAALPGLRQATRSIVAGRDEVARLADQSRI